MSFQITSKN